MTVLPPVSVIIPNFNGEALLSRNLPAVLEGLGQYPGESFLIVVDDGSSDRSLDLLARDFPGVRCIPHAHNLGFSEAIRTGVEAATTEMLVLLNSDVAPDPDFLAPLIEKLMNPGVFSVQSAIRVEGPDSHPFCLSRFSFRFGALKRRATPALGHQPWLCLYASGGSMAVRRSAFLALGGFLPLLKPFYWEDFDLGLRAWRQGLESWLVPTSRVWHQERGAIVDHVKKRKIRRALQRNKLIVEWIHFPLGILLMWGLPRVLGRLLLRLLMADFAYLGAVGGALRALPDIWTLRAEIRASARLDFAAVLARIADENACHERADLPLKALGGADAEHP